jgi:ketosteroid isomerase-like protein
MTRDEMASLVERLHRLWNTGELSEIENLYTADFIGHFPGRPLGDVKGQSGVRDAIERVRRAFADWTETVEDIIIEGDKAVTRYVSTGVHTGPFFDWPPTGERVRFTEISIFRVENGRVAEQWCLIAQTG